MHGEVGVVEVADVDGAGAVVGELVGGGAADAEGGVCAGYDDHFVFYSTARKSSALMDQARLGFVSVNWCGRLWDVRCGRVPSYAADFGYVFEGARVGGLDDKLFAEGGETFFGD